MLHFKKGTIEDPLEVEFIELPAFTRATEGLPPEWLLSLQVDLMLGRRRVVRPPGLAGFEKVRAENPLRGKGRRGGFRVYFKRYEDLKVIVLAFMTGKDVEASISAQDARRLRDLETELRKEVEAYVRGRKGESPRGGGAGRR